VTYGAGSAIYEQDTIGYVAPQAAAAAPAPAAAYWYYCTSPAGYYPYVQSCNQAWIPVVPQAPPPAGG